MKSISTTHENEIDDLNRLLDQYARKVGSLDLDLAEQIWSKTHQVSFIHPRGHQVGWEDIKQSFYSESMGHHDLIGCLTCCCETGAEGGASKLQDDEKKVGRGCGTERESRLQEKGDPDV